MQRLSRQPSRWQAVKRIPALVCIGLIRVYQSVISPWTASSCRYYPSCSAYAVEALRVHGAVRGSWLAVRRLGRCHPWTPGGVDRVPARRQGAPAAVRAREPGPLTTLTGV
jgi:uncharacterized protein